ncbi:hypothetical protein BB561_004311 [Smittium simulii]|uniref:Uncharacterized protein n=1 Tax=Smittium simulii TaxID=133385 RepID=A0A2T9YGX5_9FUNG|nr:hypothetical protein BB561_004311 [Smittium simulii]
MLKIKPKLQTLLVLLLVFFIITNFCLSDYISDLKRIGIVGRMQKTINGTTSLIFQKSDQPENIYVLENAESINLVRSLDAQGITYYSWTPLPETLGCGWGCSFTIINSQTSTFDGNYSVDFGYNFFYRWLNNIISEQVSWSSSS